MKDPPKMVHRSTTIDSLGITQYNVGEVSEYAEKKYLRDRYDEVEAEYMTRIQRKREKK